VVVTPVFKKGSSADPANYRNNRLSQTIVYVDFARAFDTVSHDKLQLKLQAYGVSGQLLWLILNFLRDRTQVTKVGCHISHSVSLTSGVVQGSCLGSYS